MRNIMLAAATVVVLALGTAGSSAAENGPDSPGTEQDRKSDQGGVVNQGTSGCVPVLANPAFHSSAAVASCRITNA